MTHAISIARRRILVDRLLHRAGKALVFSIPAALALLLVDRLFGLGVPVVVYPAIVLAALLAGVVMALAHLPGAREVSIEIDRRLNLKDRIGTAHAIANTRTALPAFAPLVVADAQRIAGGLDLRRAVPIRMRTHWTVAGVALVAFALAAWLVPTRAPAAPGPSARAIPAEVVAARDAIKASTDEIRQSLEKPGDEEVVDADSAGEAALDEQIEQLDAIAEQLSQQDPANPETAQARAEASASMSELAREMASRSQRELESLEELARRFEGLEPPAGERPLDPQLQRFLESMQQGDFDTAAEAIDEAADQAQSLDEESRSAAAEQLRELSEEIEQLARDDAAHQPPAGPTDEQPAEEATEHADAPPDDARDPTDATAEETAQSREQPVREALEDLGKSPEQIDEMLNQKQQPQSKEQTKRDLRESGADEELAEKLARDIEQVRRQRDTNERADETAKRVSDALRRTADEIEKPPPPEGQEQPEGEQAPREQQQGESEQQPDESRPQPSAAQQQPGEEQPAQREEESPEGQQRQTPKPDPDAPQQSPQETPRQTPGETPSQQPEQGEGERQQQEQQQQDQQQQRNAPAAQPDSSAAPKPGAAPQPQQTPSPDAPSMLRELQRMREAAERNQGYSEQLKERARELADTLSPEERRNLERWARAQQREQPPPPEDGPAGTLGPEQQTGEPGTKPGDQPGELQPGEARRLATDPTDADIAGDEPADGRKIGELPGDDQLIIDPDNPAAAARLNVGAQRAAERAIEQGEVPSRYHRFIQRYFRQFNPEGIHHRGTESTESTEGKN